MTQKEALAEYRRRWAEMPPWCKGLPKPAREVVGIGLVFVVLWKCTPIPPRFVAFLLVVIASLTVLDLLFLMAW